MSITSDWISAWCAIITIVGGGVLTWYGHWSRKQDRAIAAQNEAIQRLQKRIRFFRAQTNELRKYIRNLHYILKSHTIEYPTPPDSFYDASVSAGVFDESFEDETIPRKELEINS